MSLLDRYQAAQALGITPYELAGWVDDGCPSTTCGRFDAGVVRIWRANRDRLLQVGTVAELLEVAATMEEVPELEVPELEALAPKAAAPPGLLTCRELAHSLRVTVHAVGYWVQTGCPVAVRKHGGSLYDLAAVKAWRAMRRQQLKRT